MFTLLLLFIQKADFTEIPMTVCKITLFFFLRDYMLITGLW